MQMRHNGRPGRMHIPCASSVRQGRRTTQAASHQKVPLLPRHHDGGCLDLISMSRGWSPAPSLLVTSPEPEERPLPPGRCPLSARRAHLWRVMSTASQSVEKERQVPSL